MDSAGNFKALFVARLEPFASSIRILALRIATTT